MPDAMFLQIHGGDSPTMRMLELPPGPVRIGRGAHCEVRLVDPSLAEVQCILRLRGTTWHYQPVGPSGRVWIDGRAAEDPRSVAQGVPFKVGEHWLTLRSAENAFHDWVSFDDPITIVEDGPTAPSTSATATATATRPERPRTITPTPTPDENEERLRRWQTRLEQRERWLKDKQDERRWEARWKSAGESIRARSGTGTTPPKPVASPVTPTSPPPPRPNPTARPLQTPPVSRIIETRPNEPTRRVADAGPAPSLRATTPRPPVRPLPEPSTIVRRPVETPTVRMPVKPVIRVIPPSTPAEPPPAPVPISRGIVVIPPTTVDWSTARITPVEPESRTAAPSPLADPIPAPSTPTTVEAVVGWALPTIPIEPAPADDPSTVDASPELEIATVAPTSFFETVEIDDYLASIPDPEPVPDVEPAVGLGAVVESIEVEEVEVEEVVVETVGVEPVAIEVPVEVATGRIEASAWVEEISEEEIAAEVESEIEGEGEVEVEVEVARPEERAVPIAETRPEPVEVAPPRTSFTTTRWIEPAVEDTPAPDLPNRADYPSARAIFAAQGRRDRSATTAAPSASKSPRSRVREPLPTEIQAPDQWTMPLWLGWFPTLVASLFLGTLGISLAFEWLVESGGANTGLKLALRPETPVSPLIDPSLIPRGGWWLSNATHMAAWAVALERSNDGEDHSSDIRSLLGAAREASPLGARTRFNVEAPPLEPGTAVDPTDFTEIGRTRDIVSLIGTGRRLREAGKLEASIRAYRSALEMALLASRDGLEPPTFDESTPSRRYALPHEGLASLVVRDMAERGDWTAEQWTSALPSSAVGSWVASKVLGRMQKKPIADILADLAIRQVESTPPAGYDVAEHHAAVAEALAYRGRWTDSIERYRLAIDQVDDDATRRAWSLNVAELAHRTSNTDLEARSIEAAKSLDGGDEITQRARKAQEALLNLTSPNTRR